MKSSEVLRILQRNGWYKISQKGSHIRMAHEEKRNIVIVPFHGAREIGKGLEKQIFKDAGLL
jgi:predicted RNA binding protein YcfA (HicA-like mRNA interferase family)